MGKRVMIVGAGIIGAALAEALASRGADVELIEEQTSSGGVATPTSWAWINASWGNPKTYFKLRHHSMQLWRALDKTVPGLDVNWCGGLLWDLPEAELKAFAIEQASWGYGARLVEADEIRIVEPHLRAVPRLAVHVAEEGAVEPAQAVARLLAAAQNKGARVLTGVRAKRLVEDGARIVGVMTDDGVLEADDVILAAGAGVPQLLETIDVRLALDTPPGLLVHSKPAPELLRGLVMAPELHVRQTREGRLVAGTDFGGTDPGENPDAAAAALFGKVLNLISGAEKLQMDFHTVGFRPTPADGVSAIGRLKGLEGLYLVVTHSGITLAPALAALGSEEILHGARDPLIEAFSPQRLVIH